MWGGRRPTSHPPLTSAFCLGQIYSTLRLPQSIVNLDTLDVVDRDEVAFSDPNGGTSWARRNEPGPL